MTRVCNRRYVGRRLRPNGSRDWKHPGGLTPRLKPGDTDKMFNRGLFYTTPLTQDVIVGSIF